MRRALTWLAVLFLIGVGGALLQDSKLAIELVALLGGLWILVGLAWTARGVLRWLRS